jgi:rubrerythrin
MRGWNDAIDAIIDNAPTVLHDNYSEGYQDGVRKVLSERPQGKWIGIAGEYRCDKCYGKLWYRSDYCPQCGARMIKEAENE